MSEPVASENGAQRYYGKYRGTVINNIDPLKKGRLQLTVPDVSVIPATWAMPCLPFAGLQQGFYLVPPIGAGVWVEFEKGDPDYPIWTGCWWGSAAEVPAGALPTTPGAPVALVESFTKNGVYVSDVPLAPVLVMSPTGGVAIKSGVSTISVEATGITITAPQIRINGVTIVNNGALTVTL